jgi:hypothetical protein
LTSMEWWTYITWLQSWKARQIAKPIYIYNYVYIYMYIYMHMYIYISMDICIYIIESISNQCVLWFYIGLYHHVSSSRSSSIVTSGWTARCFQKGPGHPGGDVGGLSTQPRRIPTSNMGYHGLPLRGETWGKLMVLECFWCSWVFQFG